MSGVKIILNNWNSIEKIHKLKSKSYPEELVKEIITRLVNSNNPDIHDLGNN